MAPPSKAALERLVDVVTDLGSKMEAMDFKLVECYDIINSQKSYIMQQDHNLKQLRKTLDEFKLDFKSTQYTKNCHSPETDKKESLSFTFGPVMSVPQRLKVPPALNESGPQGIHNLSTESMNNTIIPVQKGTETLPGHTSTPAMKEQLTQKPLSHSTYAEATRSKTPSPVKVAAHTKPLVHTKLPAQTKPACLSAAPPRTSSLHLFNFSVETTVQDITDHLSSRLKLYDVHCEKLATRGDYSSFKLDVPAARLRSVRNYNIWPQGVSIRPFNDVTNKRSKLESKNSRTRRRFTPDR